jgi:hypothetical protein
MKAQDPTGLSSLKRRKTDTARRQLERPDDPDEEPSRNHTLPRYNIMADYINLLLAFVPLGLVAGARKWDVRLTFVFNCFALVPLARLLSLSTKVLSDAASFRTSRAISVILCNGVEMIVGFFFPSADRANFVLRSALWLCSSATLRLLDLVCLGAFCRTHCWYKGLAFFSSFLTQNIDPR